MLSRVFKFILGLFGLTTLGDRNALMREIFALERELELAIAENKALEEENKSVWDMMDELQASTKMNPGTVESFVEDIKETVLDDMLKNFKAAGEA